MIIINSLTKKFGNVIALNNISIKIPEGIIGIIGPNGSGKSTLIKLIVGLIKPTSGYIKVFGLEPYRYPKRVRKFVGVMPESPHYPKSFTCWELLRLIASVKNKSLSKNDIDFVMSLLEIQHLRDRVIGRLSYGEYRRLALAGALLGRPKLLILDEPTANIDIEGRMIISEVLKKLHKDGVNILISSHLLSELENLCEYVVILVNGEIFDHGPLNSILKRYRIPPSIVSQTTSLEELFLKYMRGMES